LNGEFEPGLNETDCPADWQAKRTLTFSAVMQRLMSWLREQSTLFEAFFVAVSFHVLLFPLIWFAGWALPWPKPPAMTVVIELNLENWPNVATPEKIEEIFGDEMAKARYSKHTNR
jgi:hypothetical protein